MTGPQPYRTAAELAAKASQYPGPGDGQDSAAVRAAVAQVHARLALDAAIATTAAARAPPQARQYTPAATKTPTPRGAPVATDPGCPDPATVKPQAAKEHVPTPQGVNTPYLLARAYPPFGAARWRVIALPVVDADPDDLCAAAAWIAASGGAGP